MNLLEIAQHTFFGGQYSTKKQLYAYLKNTVPEKLQQLGVTYTSMDKVGINPRSTHNTPIGVYFYPAQYVRELFDAGEEVPYAGNSTHVTVLDISELALLQISEVSANQYEQEARKLRGASERVGKIVGAHASDVRKLINIEMASDRDTDVPGFKLWSLMYKLLRINSTAEEDPYTSEEDPEVNPVDRQPSKWSALIMILGYDGVVDFGQGIIHENEPTQGFIIRTDKLKVVRRFNKPQINRYYSSSAGEIREVIDELYDYHKTWTPSKVRAKHIVRLTYALWAHNRLPEMQRHQGWIWFRTHIKPVLLAGLEVKEFPATLRTAHSPYHARVDWMSAVLLRELFPTDATVEKHVGEAGREYVHEIMRAYDRMIDNIPDGSESLLKQAQEVQGYEAKYLPQIDAVRKMFPEVYKAYNEKRKQFNNVLRQELARGGKNEVN